MSFPLPHYYVIEPTNVCNLRCKICPHSAHWMNINQGFMEMKLFHQIMNQISDNARVIQLYWMGEPLLHDKIFEMIKFCKEGTKAKVIISTNGMLLTKENLKKMVEVGLDELIISADACNNQEIYGAIRTGGLIEVLNENIVNALTNRGDMKVVLQFIDMFINKEELQPFIDKWKSYDCELDISCLYSWSNQMPELNYASDNLSPVKGKIRAACADLWNKMCIHWDGDVSACCFDYSNKLPLGNCKDTSLADIWNDESINKLREDHTRGIYDKRLCIQCDAWAEQDEYVFQYRLSGEN